MSSCKPPTLSPELFAVVIIIILFQNQDKKAVKESPGL